MVQSNYAPEQKGVGGCEQWTGTVLVLEEYLPRTSLYRDEKHGISMALDERERGRELRKHDKGTTLPRESNDNKNDDSRDDRIILT